MKKLFFLSVFVLFFNPIYSQIYLVSISSYDTGNCRSEEVSLTKVSPEGNISYSCINDDIRYNGESLLKLNIELNEIIDLGYSLVEISTGDYGMIKNNYLNEDVVFIFSKK